MLKTITLFAKYRIHPKKKNLLLEAANIASILLKHESCNKKLYAYFSFYKISPCFTEVIRIN